MHTLYNRNTSWRYLSVASLWVSFILCSWELQLRVPVRFGVTLECQPVTRLSASFFPLTGGKGTPWKQDIVGAFFFSLKIFFNCDIVLVCLRQSHYCRGGGGGIVCELPFKRASPLHYQRKPYNCFNCWCSRKLCLSFFYATNVVYFMVSTCVLVSFQWDNHNDVGMAEQSL